tara:strand:+ start:934 stop:1743 length:810 start_codon:yes stop_codon:yes gene_type:complete
MDIESNFNQNLKSSVKKHSSSLQSADKFILQSMLKNLDEVEGMLDDDTLVEYKVGDIKNVLEEAKKCTYSFECKGGKTCQKGWCKKCKECKGKTLKGDQHKLDMNKNGKLDSEDFKMLGKKQETEEATTTSSSGAYITPRFWAKKKRKKKSKVKSSRKSKSNGKRMMPGAQFVKVKDKCKTFPYCNQGDITALELWEKKVMSEAAKAVSKKTGVSEDGVRKMIEKELGEVIRRSLYKSPITDLVGTGKMDTPIGKIFTMNSNAGSKYES